MPDYAPGLQQPRRGAARRRPARRSGRALSPGARAQARLRQRQLQPRQRAARAGQGRRFGGELPRGAASRRRTPSRRTTTSASRSPSGRRRRRDRRVPRRAGDRRSLGPRASQSRQHAVRRRAARRRAWRISSARSQLAPSEPEAVYDIGTILLQDQNFAAAAARFEAALKIRPDWAEAHNNLGIALASQGRIAEALTHFERAVELKPVTRRRPRQSRSGAGALKRDKLQSRPNSELPTLDCRIKKGADPFGSAPVRGTAQFSLCSNLWPTSASRRQSHTCGPA